MLTAASAIFAVALLALTVNEGRHVRRRRADRQNRLERAWWRADR